MQLGTTPLANALVDPGKADAPRYPLDLVLCQSCALYQLGEIVDPEKLFAEYVYFSSFSDALLKHSAATVATLMESERLGADSLVVEIASNDGYLLQYFKERGVPVLGIEPARNIAKVAVEQRGIPTISRFFGVELAEELAARGTKADLVLGNNVLAHVPDLNGFARGVRRVLKATGVAAFEVPYLKDMLDHAEFDTIYHEHQCYFSLTALDALFRRHDLTLYDVRRLPIHGGSMRVYVAPAGTRKRTATAQSLLTDEAAWGVATREPYELFAGRVEQLKRELRSLLARLKSGGHRIGAYGAAAKGVTLLASCGIGAETIDFVVDRSTYKQGRGFPVDGLPIFPPEELVARRPDYALLLTWNFAAEILQQQAAYTAAGGRFITPVPRPTILGS